MPHMDITDKLAARLGSHPPPEVATPEDVAEYNNKYLKTHGQTEQDTDDGAAGLFTQENPYGEETEAVWKAAGDGSDKPEFPWTKDPPYGVSWDFDPVALRTLAQPNTWVGTLVQTITTEVSQTPWSILQDDERGASEVAKRLNKNPEERDRGPIAKAPDDDETARQIEDLIFSPNPDDNTTDLLEMFMSSLLEIGSLAAIKSYPSDSYATVERAGEETPVLRDDVDAPPEYILPSPPEIWTKDYGGDIPGVTRGYWQFGERSSPAGPAGSSSGLSRSDATFFSRSELIWNDFNKRDNRTYGLPPTLLVEDFLRSVDLAVTQEQNYFARGAIPNSIINAPDMDKQEAKERQRRFTSNIKGKPHKLAFMSESELSIHDMSHSFQELQFTERVQYYAKVIASAFQVPTAVVGLQPEKVNYATFRGERQNFESNALGPYLQELERVINSELVWPDFGREYRFEFVPGMSESSRSMVSERVRSEVAAGIATPNEARRATGREEVDEPGADTLGPVPGALQEQEKETETEQGRGRDYQQSTESTEDTTDTLAQSEYEVGGETLDLSVPEYMRAAAETGQDIRDRTESLAECGTGAGNETARHLVDDTVGPSRWTDIAAYLTSHADDVEGLGRYTEWSMETVEERCGPVQYLLWGGTGDGAARRKAQVNANRVAIARDEEPPYPGLSTQSSSYERTTEETAKNDALRNDPDHHEAPVQPADIQALADDLSEPVDSMLSRVLESDELRAAIDRLSSEAADRVEKSHWRTTAQEIAAVVIKSSANQVRRVLEQVFDNLELREQVESIVESHAAEQARAAAESAISELDGTTDPDPVVQAVRARDRDVLSNYTDSMAEQIVDTVAEGWTEGKTTTDIMDDLQEQKTDITDWGAERVARQELQVATGTARSEVMNSLGKIEIWTHSGDYPERENARESHDKMDGTWKYPRDSWTVDYSPEGGPSAVTEDTPGDSKHGIGCRCFVVGRERDEVADEDYAGDGTP